MSLSRPARLSLLKLPWLCIKCVLLSSDLFDIIYFATISNRTRRIVRQSKYPLKEIDVDTNMSRIRIGEGKYWDFSHDKYEFGVPLVLKRNSEPFFTNAFLESWGVYSLHSYTAGDIHVLKMGINFMIEVFGCTVREAFFEGNKLSELSGLAITSVKELFIADDEPVNIKDLKYLFETIKVTDSYGFYVPIPANFVCDPQIFKCRLLYFSWKGSADWVTLELLCQFNVPQLTFFSHRFSVEDIVSYITHWFNSEKRKLEYAQFYFNNPVSLEDFQIDHLNPMPFCEKRRSKCPFVEGWEDTDISSGKDILRQDGLLATIFVEDTYMLFYVWHKRFPDDV